MLFDNFILPDIILRSLCIRKQTNFVRNSIKNKCHILIEFCSCLIIHIWDFAYDFQYLMVWGAVRVESV